MFKYFVSYSHTTGFGMCEIFQPYPIDSFEDVVEIATHLQDENPKLGRIVILSWQLLESGPDAQIEEEEPTATDSVFLKYEKIPVVVEAAELTPNTAQGIADKMQSQGVYISMERDLAGVPMELSISTLEGVMTARMGDYIIRGVAGEFYPCKPEIFEQTYQHPTV